MPTMATEILTVDAAKAALRVDGTAGDGDLEASIAAAVAYCERHADIPLLDVERTFFLDPPSLSTNPLIVPVVYILPGYENAEDGTHPRGVVSIRYWTVAGTLRLPPDGSIAVSNLGRVDKVNRDCTGIWPDADGWPTVLTDSQFEVTVTLGWPSAGGDTEADDYDIAAAIPGIAGVRRAVTLATGLMYDGSTDTQSWDVVHNLLGPFMDMRFRV